MVYLRFMVDCVCDFALQWAERLLEGGGSEQWGENWEESFKQGTGGKKVRLK